MKGLIYFVLGAGIGAGASWMIAKEYYRTEADEEQQSKDRMWQRKLDAEKENAMELFNKCKDAEEAAGYYKGALVRLGAEMAKTMPEEIPGEDKSEESSEDDDEEDEIDPADEEFPIEGEDYFVNDTRNATPYAITEEQWAEEMHEFFDKITLVYYLKDEMLLAEDGGLVDDIYRVIGTDWEDKIVHDGDEAFIRNELVGADYFIIAKDEYGIDNIKEEYDEV